MNSITPLHEKMSGVVTANGNAFNAFVRTALSASEQLFALNLNTVRSFEANTAAPESGNFFEHLTAQAVSPARSLELASDYLRNVTEICIKSQAEIAQINIERANELADAVGTLLDTLAKSAPSGSAEVFEQLKAALGTATGAYQSVIRTTGEIAERNLAAASEAVQPVIDAASRTEKKRATKAA